MPSLATRARGYCEVVYDNAVFETIYSTIAPLLGQLTGRKAIELACQQAGLDPRALTPVDVAKIVPKLKLMMVTLLGNAATGRVLTDVQARLRASTRP
jgi:hypothetical protein